MTNPLTRRQFLEASAAGALGAALAAQDPAPPALDLRNRLAVCSWSLQPASAEELFTRLAETGIARIQLALDPLRMNERGAWSDFAARAKAHGVTLVSGALWMIGEDYTSPASIQRTGGVVPDTSWPENWKNIQADADLAAELGLGLVTFHAGFIPPDEKDPTFAKVLERIRTVADAFRARGLVLGLETGQESAETLVAFLRKLAHPNVGVNLDPANMLLYDKGDPLAAVKTLAPWLKQCHLKDGKRTKVPGQWGEEVVLGTGQVDWKRFFAALAEARFSGDLAIEREAGTQRAADIRAAREYVERLSS